MESRKGSVAEEVLTGEGIGRVGPRGRPRERVEEIPSDLDRMLILWTLAV